MTMKRYYQLLTFAALAAVTVMSGCTESYENVADHNRLWDAEVERVSLTLLNGKENNVTRTMSVVMAQPELRDVNVTYGVSPEKLADYNNFYSDHAQLLPAANYSFTTSVATIPAGGVSSGEAVINFTDLDKLNDDSIYVLPVSIITSDVEALASRSTTYYLFRGASLINTVGNMTSTCLRFVREGECPALGNLSKMTFEVLMRPDKFTNMLSTLLGIEDKWLIRIGDAGLPSNQLQVAARPNVTDEAWQFETGKWTFLTLTFDGTTGAVDVYFNGVKKGQTRYTSPTTINWNVVSTDRACYIGYSYEPDRDFQGDLCEMRVWNRILTVDEINSRDHFYRVDTDADGLVAYWKFDEGAGNLIHDYANGYDMAVPATYPGKSSEPGDIKWNPVNLPK